MELSVIIPNFNKSDKIVECIESVEKQTFPVKEIFVIDDCSTDDSRHYIEELAAKYTNITPVFLEKNGGVSHARNVGLSKVTTDYVVVLDSDDYYYSADKLSAEMALIEKYAAKGEDILAYSKLVIVADDGTFLGGGENSTIPHPEGNVHRALMIGKSGYIQMRDYCIKTSILRDVGGFNEKHSYYEDWELLLILSRKVRFFFTDVCGTAYRDSVNGLSKKAANPTAAMMAIFKEQLAEESAFNRFRYSFERYGLLFYNKSVSWFYNNIYSKIKK